jgi:Domain of unknown function (DUF4124)
MMMKRFDPQQGVNAGRGTAAPGMAPDALAFLLFAAALSLAPAAFATTYKWVDDQGIVHYSDKIPPEAVNKGSVELNKQGIPVHRIDPALTPEQRRAREVEDERARQAAKIREDMLRKDRALLQSYTTEGEIDLAKKRALGTLDTQVQSAQAFIVTLGKRKQEITSRIAGLGDKPVPAAMETELNNVNDELVKQEDLIASKRKDGATIAARYDADKKRWQELRTAAEAEASAASVTPATTPAAKK